MAAPKGNQFWKLRSKHGRDKLFESPELLLEAAQEYFNWCDKHPLKEQKAFSYQGKITRTSLNKMRAYTLDGLCLYLGCSESYFRKFKSKLQSKEGEDFFTVIEHIEKVIYNQKFTGAAADLLNANIIARDLGLSDKVDSKNTNFNHNYESISKEELKEISEALEDEY